jgi:hypothetical protein
VDPSHLGLGSNELVDERARHVALNSDTSASRFSGYGKICFNKRVA